MQATLVVVTVVRSLILLALLAAPRASLGYDVTGRFSIGGLVAGAMQCQKLTDDGTDDTCRGAVAAQPEFRFQPSDAGEVSIKLGFSSGNALEAVSPFSIPVWAADLEDGVRHINGSGRSHLLTASYRHRFETGPGETLHITAGFIDATDYLDGNAYANDEFSQFMNGALVNSPNGFVPSYDAGIALEWDTGNWSMRGVYMRVNSNDIDRGYDYLGLQAGYRVRSALGEGNLRLLFQETSRDFAAAQGAAEVPRRAWIVSIDQALAETFGVWARLGWQDDAAAIDFKSLYSGGVNLRGSRWTRPADDIGIGAALVRGGNLDIAESRVFEGYYRVVLSPPLSVTADVQHVTEITRTMGRISGWVFGLRMTMLF